MFLIGPPSIRPTIRPSSPSSCSSVSLSAPTSRNSPNTDHDNKSTTYLFGCRDSWCAWVDSTGTTCNKRRCMQVWSSETYCKALAFCRTAAVHTSTISRQCLIDKPGSVNCKENSVQDAPHSRFIQRNLIPLFSEQNVIQSAASAASIWKL